MSYHKRMTRVVDGVKFGFEWYGGPYIEVCRGEAFASPSEVINVWDYAKDAPRIPRTDAGLAAKIDDWIADYGADNLVHDATVNW
jgi:hypothetical protein